MHPAWIIRRKSFLSAIDLLVELASLQTAFLTLDEAIKTTNRCARVLVEAWRSAGELQVIGGDSCTPCCGRAGVAPCTQLCFASAFRADA